MDKYPIKDGTSLNILNQPPLIPVIPVRPTPIMAIGIIYLYEGIFIDGKFLL